MWKNIIRITIKVVAFVIIFAMLFVTVQNVLIGDTEKDAPRVRGFYDLEENTLDAIFLGSSATYAFWNPPVAWSKHGIAVYSYASANQSPVLAKYLIEETQKTQPDASYIINLNAIDCQMTVEDFHKLTDYMPNSLTRFKVIEYGRKLFDYTKEETSELMFPIIRYHDRWQDLTKKDFLQVSDPYLSGSSYSLFHKKQDVSGGLGPDCGYREMPEKTKAAMADLLEYIKEKNVKVTFVVVPSGTTEVQQIEMLNSCVDFVESYGYDVLDMRYDVEKIGIDYKTDFYNPKHTNVRGSIKITEYISKHLIKTFGFEDKRGQEEYKVWDEAYEKYYNEYLSEKLTDEEINYRLK